MAICSVQIKDNFWFAHYVDFEYVVMMKDCGYVNATKMCRGAGMEFNFWKASAHSRALIHALEAQLCGAHLFIGDTSPTMIVVKPTGELAMDLVLAGTYIHPKLLPHLACWISPKFALMVSVLTNSATEAEAKRVIDAKRAVKMSCRYDWNASDKQ